MRGTVVGLMLLALGLALHAPAGAYETLRVYLDADQTVNQASGRAIEYGIRTAFAEIDWEIQGYPIQLLALDHRGNSRRSRGHLERFTSDSSAMAMFCGLHSPPVLENKSYINANEILLLDPWAAAGQITRTHAEENWIYRLSIDDRKAGEVIIEHLHRVHGRSHPALVLESTGWGDSNRKTMLRALQERDLDSSGIFRFQWGIPLQEARQLVQDVRDSGADSIVLVANAPEGATLARAMLELPPDQRLPVFSHWGITGGGLDAAYEPELGWEFIQTGFPFHCRPDAPLVQEVVQRAVALFPKVESITDIRAPAGFIHAYDLTRILIAAIEQARLSGTIRQDRRAVRQAMEQLRDPVPGLLKTYRRPFAPYSPKRPDAHEALGRQDFHMGTFDPRGRIVPAEPGFCPSNAADEHGTP